MIAKQAITLVPPQHGAKHFHYLFLVCASLKFIILELRQDQSVIILISVSFSHLGCSRALEKKKKEREIL